jgi:hypothetical protein
MSFSKVSMIAVCLVFSLVSVSAFSAEEITVLSVEEHGNVLRKDEPVRMGIPLPVGLIKDVNELAMLDSTGQPVPCQFKLVSRWLKDNSVKWVHAVFKANVAAKGKTLLKLVKVQARKTGAGVRAIKNGDGSVTVENGLLKIVIKGKGFNLIDSAWYDPKGKYGPGTEVIKPHKSGVRAVLDGKEHKPGSDSLVKIEELGSQGAVVKVSGYLVSDGAAGTGPLTYVCYIHIFKGSPEVRVTFAYTNASGQKASSLVNMEDLSVSIPLVASKSARAGGAEKVYTGKSLKVVASGSDSISFSVDAGQSQTEPGKKAKSLKPGWVALGKGASGLALELRWFWQMHPRALEASDGVVTARFFAGGKENSLDVYMGQGRTHYLTMLFAPGVDADLQRVFAGRQLPLRAACTPKYYCRTTAVFGPLVDSDKSLFDEEIWAKVKKYDKDLKASINYIESKIEGHSYNGVRIDSYGYNAWGDLFHHANTRGVTDKWNIQWESNYYDYPFACLLQFVRTGDQQFLNTFDRNGLHLGDVFMCKWHPKKHMRGACRYSPPANHVGSDVNYKKFKPYVSVEFNHHKAQSILYRYLLLGDLRARDDFMLALNNATLNKEGSWRQCRGAGAKLWTLTEGYRLTGGPKGDPRLLAMMKRTVAGGAKRAKIGGSKFGHSNGQFMYGFASEGLIRYWWLFKDQSCVTTMKVMNDWLIGRNLKGATSNSCMSMAWLWRHTGEEKYKKAAIKLLRTKRMSRPKHFGSSVRSTPYALYYLSKLAASEK